MIGIYKIENRINGKIYIGQSIAIKTRWQQHKYEANTGESQAPFYLALRKYGIENFSFEVLEECPQELLNEKEIFWIAHYKSNDRNFGYNVLAGGQNGGVLYPNEWFYELWDAGFAVTEIKKELGVSRKTVRAKLEGYKDYNVHNSRSRGAIKAINEGRLFPNGHLFPNQETYPVYQYNLMGDFIQSFPNATEAARNFSNKPNCSDNITHAVNGIQETAYGFQWRREKIEKLSPVPLRSGRLVECIETGELFPSSQKASEWAKLKSRSNITACCLGKRKSAGKHPETGEKLHWCYYEDN